MDRPGTFVVRHALASTCALGTFLFLWKLPYLLLVVFFSNLGSGAIFAAMPVLWLLLAASCTGLLGVFSAGLQWVLSRLRLPAWLPIPGAFFTFFVLFLLAVQRPEHRAFPAGEIKAAAFIGGIGMLCFSAYWLPLLFSAKILGWMGSARAPQAKSAASLS